MFIPMKSKIEKYEVKEEGDNMIYKCPICKERVEIMTTLHLQRHGLTMDEFKEQYPEFFSRKTQRRAFNPPMKFTNEQQNDITADHDHKKRMINQR